ncbi:rhomboid family intramembrane serine protease [Longimonas halophila]|uniref:Rhomboid family intramembrane serine protease n=1 Tax=Longimonas halophila TaxID=1469170 RepID=A0A2H3NM91_9BACT|nr:rhomboid family intramembrane serine protease [Longimonas halophila]PEN07644.1 rhomboid family intramembrane serine protease [Longimonas halophila]
MVEMPFEGPISLVDVPVTTALLLANIVVSWYVLYRNPRLLDPLSFQPYRIANYGEYYRFLTAGFVHGNGAHLAVNMITLFFFGPVLEGLLGAFGFLVLYVLCEILAHTVTFTYHYDDPQYAAIGASGAVSGVVFGFCLFFPLELLYLFFILPIPAVLFAVGYVVGSIYASNRNQRAGQRGGIAHEAHIGGAIAGIIVTIALDPRALDSFVQTMSSLL